MADIFISYSKKHAELTESLARDLEAVGYTTWWDTSLLPGDEFPDEIKRQLDAAKSVIVIWTESSVVSRWVRSEAALAYARKKLLITVRDARVDVNEIPLPFNTLHAELITDRARIFAALARQGIAPSNSQPMTSASPVNREGRIKIDAAIGHGAPNGWFKPGAGLSEWFKDFDAGPEMVVIPAGSFMMGSPPDETDRFDAEGPKHEIVIAKPFAVGRYAVSFDEWDAFAAYSGFGGSPSDRGWGRGQRPVIGVNWNDAAAYVAWLGEKSGKHYRLLSEAEWEYVCRAGSVGPFWWGSPISTDQANYCGDRWIYDGGPLGEYREETMPVNSFRPNPWGLYQVHGNVFEWVEDRFHDDYKGAPADGSAWTAGDEDHVIRGGSWNDWPTCLRAAYRDKRRIATGKVGLRVARTLDS
jgi:formylglycine-generating enzyme required for sulfatase activity